MHIVGRGGELCVWGEWGGEGGDWHLRMGTAEQQDGVEQGECGRAPGVLEGNRNKRCKVEVEEHVEGDGEVSARGIRVCVEGNGGCEHTYGGMKGTWGHVAWKGGTPGHTERSVVLDKNSVSWRAEKVPGELGTWGAVVWVRCAQRSLKGCGAQTEVSKGLREEDGVSSQSCQLSPRSLGQSLCRAMLQARKTPGRCGSLRLPRQRRRGAAISAVPGEEEETRLRWP